ncbi:MAG TPA: tetratricopeptide repeat protein [Pyrinomonadaceae bacterium]|nr:tetratricopeptide repeat protein [Pyrinomonadaceae bacterium]
MKRCPQCNRVEADDTLTFCRVDGTPLIRESGAVSEGAGTLKLGSTPTTGDTETRILPTGETLGRPTSQTTILDAQRVSGGTQELSKSQSRRGVAIAAVVIAVALAASAYLYLSRDKGAAKNSIAVLPFANAGGDPNMEYLSDGMTESLINSLSQLPNLAVKARSTVFRYKGKEANTQTVGSELNVQAVLNGRVLQRGDDLTLSLELVDAKTGDQMWGEQYNRKLTDLVSLQREIARDVTDRLRVKLSGTDEQRLTKSYATNSEAYQLYLRGRYHVFKLTPPEVNKGIAYFQQAIGIDPSYALAYAGLSDAYRSLALGGEMLPSEFLPKAKAAAQRAIEIDDSLSEAHTALGVSIFWYEWDWNASESQYKRALVLNPNDANAHLFYAHLFSNTGRHAEALVEVKRARELDPLSPYVNALEGQFLIHAGRTDEALDRLRKTFELDPNFWMPHLYLSSAYIEKGLYQEAVAEARKARQLSAALTLPVSLESYALAKSGKRGEARALLNELLKLSTERFVPPSHIALAYNGLGEADEAIAWLRRGVEQRDPKMTFLKVEPKWNNLRSDPRFADLMRRVGLPQ